MNRRDIDPTTSAAAAFGARLRSLRDERGWTQEDLASRIGCTGSHISAVETGRRSPTQRFAAGADRALGTSGRLERQSRSVRETSLLEGFPEFVALEASAAEIRLFEVGIIPGLLQTPDYAEAITRGAVRRGAITEQQAEERLTLLAKRQDSLLRSPAPLVYAVLDEGCIRRTVGGPQTMAAQLDHLLLLAERSSVVVQLTPFDLGERRAFDLPVTLLTLRDRSQIAYSESAQSGRLERETRYVQPLVTAYHHLQVEASPQEQSLAAIEQLRKGTP
ncbi:helix-turn-helix domain-containing protein [Streptomyces lonarensis]|uniref:Helix-turn-helix domain-containing protein n=1 Tax=Streptomyces lonarensis TaxID=700599 RepID=A0A7X6D0V9_9ACTN|nr:helix-turn-helix domain-containing protein [Streptomyces lonarensis]